LNSSWISRGFAVVCYVCDCDRPNRFEQAIRGNEANLTRQIDIESGLLIQLQALGVLTDWQLSNVGSKVSHALRLSARYRLSVDHYILVMYLTLCSLFL